MTNLERVRRERGQSLRALADDVGCSYNTLFNYERYGRRPFVALIRNGLEEVTGYPISVLLSHDPKLLERTEATSE